MMQPPIANTFKVISFVVAVCLPLAACGYHLRGSGPALAQALYVEGLSPNDSFANTFRSTVSIAGGRLVPAVTQADGVIHIYRANHLRRYLALSRAGRSVEYDLSYRVLYDVRTPKGEVLLARQEIETKRDYFNDQTLPLGQAEEEGLIRQELEKEAAQALLRRAIFALKQAPDKKS
jgi:LPS-assembly lipoprotein